jgi:hypothetical protein
MMRFYFFSLLSWIAWVVYGVIAVALVSLLWTKLLKLRLRNPGYWVLVAAILIAPWVEELWIANNFDRLCSKDAGIFINKIVEADGYYDGTRKITRLVGRPPFKFIESADDGGRYRRVEHATGKEKADALAWYQKTKEKQPGEKEWFTRPVSDDVRVVVEMDTGHAWRVTTLDKPTARYMYTAPQQSTPIGYKIRKTERTVTDSQTQEVLARETLYARDAYWFFIALGAPVMLCQGVDQRESPSVGSIHNAVLVPVQQ